MRVRTVTLELLRHGPAHNQLLSPLTPYLALCGNRGAETFHLPIEHWHYMSRVAALGYEAPEELRQVGLLDATQYVTHVLASIRNLAAELSSVPEGELVHLRLVLSASELASLPFELADAPAGFPAAGLPLFLQGARPISLTRESRREQHELLSWPERPRILFAYASPPSLAPVPAEAHLLALRRALHPWLGWQGPKGLLHELGTHLYVLPDATLSAIADACSRQQFTHVHLLAHGAPLPTPLGQTQYGLALMSPGSSREAFDVVSGRRLEEALCPRTGERRPPTVVSLATCESGRVGTAILPGGSLAHDLNLAGVPLVVGSQFPLTFVGSAVLVDRLYAGLMRGEDPRTLLHDLRRDLQLKCPHTHDWASLVAYATLPPGLDSTLRRVGRKRTGMALDVALARVRETFLERTPPLSPTPGAADEAVDDGRFDQPERGKQERDRLDQAAKGMQDVLAQAADAGEAADAHAWLASAALRWAEIRHNSAVKLESLLTSGAPKNHPVPFAELTKDDALRLAGLHYRRTFLAGRAFWGLQMSLLIEIARKGFCDAAEWAAARVLAEAVVTADRNGVEGARSDAAWRDTLASAHDALAQLWLMAGAALDPADAKASLAPVPVRAASPAPPDGAPTRGRETSPTPPDGAPTRGREASPILTLDEAAKRAEEHLRLVLEVAGYDSFRAFAATRQMQHMSPQGCLYPGERKAPLPPWPPGWSPAAIAEKARDLQAFMFAEGVAAIWPER